MIPNLALIVAAYVFVRLVSMIIRQIPALEQGHAGRATVVVLSSLALVLVVLCTLDILGAGLAVGSAVDAARGGPLR